MLRLIRQNFDSILEKPIFKHRFKHYQAVLKGKEYARYLIAKKTPVNVSSLENKNLDQLWEYHKTGRVNFNHLRIQLKDKYSPLGSLPTPSISFLDLKCKIATEIIKSCHFCERRCRVDRSANKIGFCRLNHKSIVTSAFLHIGEEPPLIPSGTVFFTGCTFSCVFCQNWSISQEWGDIQNFREGRIVSPSELARIISKLSLEGARNINWVGGDPTPNIHTILESLKYFEKNVIQLWNSNMYTSQEGMDLILDIMDFWLPDLKFFENDFALKMTKAKNYWEVITRNIKYAYDYGEPEMIVRHLVMPERVKADTFSILEWCANNVPEAFVNIMGQWYPDHKILDNPNHALLDRRISREELEESRDFADQLGILWRDVG
ncbi:MAG: radical SAM protein [Candidatus Heimdallarchaeota archaeon]|nr:radical SAM protein [Candidatus Heimdallarchaeota archaeon]